jgi:hypothetical protein
VGIQPAPPVDKEADGIQRRGGMMDNQLWTLVPWAVFAFAIGLKVWRMTPLFRKHLLGIPTRTERFRQGLERRWIKDQRTL